MLPYNVLTFCCEINLVSVIISLLCVVLRFYFVFVLRVMFALVLVNEYMIFVFFISVRLTKISLLSRVIGLLYIRSQI